MIAKAIIFKATHKLVRPMFPAFQANVATLTPYPCCRRTSGDRFDLDRVWQEQAISERLREQIQVWAREVNDTLHATANGRMISEWAKKAECWDAVQNGNLSLPLSDIPELR